MKEGREGGFAPASVFLVIFSPHNISYCVHLRTNPSDTCLCCAFFFLYSVSFHGKSLAEKSQAYETHSDLGFSVIHLLGQSHLELPSTVDQLCAQCGCGK